MKEYHKIDSVYKRDERGRFIVGEFSRPEFEYLAFDPWLWTEKIDGTNIRIMWKGRGEFPVLGGKTDNAQLPNKLVANLNAEGKITADRFEEVFGDSQVCLYGEGYGAGIQSGGNYSPEQKFILFDVKIGDLFLERHNVEDIASKLGIDVVPLMPEGALGLFSEENTQGVFTLGEVISRVAYAAQNDQIAKSSINKNALVEGWVGTPLVPLFNRRGERIITKVKYKDFRTS